MWSKKDFDKTENSDTIKRSYVYGNCLDEILMKIEDTDAADDLCYARDRLFRPVAMIESESDVVERCEYDAYGKSTDRMLRLFKGIPPDRITTLSPSGESFRPIVRQ